MQKLARTLAVVGSLALLSVPLSLFWNAWAFTWVAAIKLAVGILCFGIWLRLNSARLRAEGASFKTLGGLTTLLVLLSLILLNILAAAWPVRLDCTAQRLQSLSAESRSVLAGLSDEVVIEAYYAAGDPGLSAAQAWLERYALASRWIRILMVDPQREVGRAEREHITADGARLVLRRGERRERVRLGENPESEITNALLALIRQPDALRLCLLTGHGEPDADARVPSESIRAWVADLTAEGISVAPLSLLETASVPADCRALGVVGARAALRTDELLALQAWLAAPNARLLLLVGADDDASLISLVARLGVKLGTDLLTQPGARDLFEITARLLEGHTIADRLGAAGRPSAILPRCRSLGLEAPAQELLRSAGGEPVAAATDSGGVRAVVIGSSAAAVDTTYTTAPLNRSLLLAGAAWLLEGSAALTIRPRLRPPAAIALDESDRRALALLCADLLPLSILALGLLIWQARRSS